MKRADGLRGMVRLAITATRNVADVAQAMQSAIGGAPARFFSAPVYLGIRGITSLVGGTLDAGLSLLAPLLGEAETLERNLFLAALNGVLGDHLAATGNALAIADRLQWADDAPPTGKILILVHGSAMNAQSWSSARARGFTLVHYDYNSGLHVSTNGRALAAAVEKLAAEWPVPVEEIAMVAHSMGGLVARSACHYGAEQRWMSRLRTIVFLGTPHHGAPLERAGNWLETLLGVTGYSAPLAGLARLRSAGVTDLRFGNLLDEDWQGRDRFDLDADSRKSVPLPPRVACYAIAAEQDGLVPMASAFGDHDTRGLDIPEAHRFLARGCGHVDLLSDAAVWDSVENWIGRT
jgi:pimeloyl-ACP methyl ester carboxylesterase